MIKEVFNRHFISTADRHYSIEDDTVSKVVTVLGLFYFIFFFLRYYYSEYVFAVVIPSIINFWDIFVTNDNNCVKRVECLFIKSNFHVAKMIYYFEVYIDDLKVEYNIKLLKSKIGIHVVSIRRVWMRKCITKNGYCLYWYALMSWDLLY